MIASHFGVVVLDSKFFVTTHPLLQRVSVTGDGWYLIQTSDVRAKMNFLMRSFVGKSITSPTVYINQVVEGNLVDSFIYSFPILHRNVISAFGPKSEVTLLLAFTVVALVHKGHEGGMKFLYFFL